MPYIDLLHPSEAVSIWYTSSSRLGTVNSLLPDKPTIVMLHPLYLNSSWLWCQMDDPRLNSSYNIIAFDTRTSGKSMSTPSGMYDTWVQAADLALCFQYLHLPPVHLVGIETVSVSCAQRFAILFPDMVLSLTLINVPPPTELKTNLYMLDELIQLYSYAEDLDTYEHAAKELSTFFAGPGCEGDLLDDLIGFWEQSYPPSRRSLTMQNLNLIKNASFLPRLLFRTPLPRRMLEAINSPVLIIQSESSQIYPLEHAQALADNFKSAGKDARLFVVKGIAGYLTIMNPSIVNQTLLKFLGRLPRVRSDIKPPSVPVAQRMREALDTLAELTGDPSFSEKDAMCSLNFSCVSPEICKIQVKSRESYAKDAAQAFSPLQPNGRPIRKYSEGRKDHWFVSESNGLSYAGKFLLPTLRGTLLGLHE
ncbi:alpha/beta-hydrolase [Thelephora ganbajun]|uniref:Alpha/beta-hydrolase n=1 Tax=Thelephora ganbajun TaxID=370292 RepID=A0ACB6ZI92_THEGA|nr:alpha/beta-hydrolase [Thelephora ganbajun]